MSRAWAKASAAIAVFALGTAAHEASAQDEQDTRDGRIGGRAAYADGPVFGDRRQIAISTDAALSIERRTQDGARATTTLSILPAFDYFVVENLSVGGVIGVTYQKAGDDRATSFRLGPRIGYNFRISQLLSLWPKLGFSYSYNKVKSEEGDLPNGGDVTVTRGNNAIALNLFAPVMLHPAPHFFAGFGPFLDTDLNGDNRATTWGFRLTVGGWL